MTHYTIHASTTVLDRTESEKNALQQKYTPLLKEPEEAA